MTLSPHDYELDIALAIAKDFSDRWDGCPAEERTKMTDRRDEN